MTSTAALQVALLYVDSMTCVEVAGAPTTASQTTALGPDWTILRLLGERASPDASRQRILPGLSVGTGSLDEVTEAIAEFASSESPLGLLLVSDRVRPVELMLAALEGAEFDLIGVEVEACAPAVVDELTTVAAERGYATATQDDEQLWLVRASGIPPSAIGEAIRRAGDDDKPAEGTSNRLLAVLRQLESAGSENRRLRAQLATPRPGLHRSVPPNEGLAMRLREMELSNSWRVTAPIRSVVDFARSLRSGDAQKESRRRAREHLRPDAAHPRLTYRSSAADGMLLRARLVTACEALGLDPGEGDLDVLLAAQAPSARDAWWLIHIAYVGGLPSTIELDSIMLLVRSRQSATAIAKLRALRAAHSGAWQTIAPLRIVRTPVLDATFAATTGLHTGVQRVVRGAAPFLEARGAMPVVLDETARAWRDPSASERRRLMLWDGGPTGVIVEAEYVGSDVEIVVPWKTTVVIPELRPPADLELLRCAASSGANEFAAIVHDMIPVTMSEWVPDEVTAGFGTYLSAIKHFVRISTVSRSVEAEFAGFVRALQSQGMKGPAVKAQPLPIVAPPPRTANGTPAARRLRLKRSLPLFIQVGSITPHKNQAGTLEAASSLWDRGFKFELLFVAPNQWQGAEFANLIEQQRHLRRPVSIAHAIPDDVLWQLYRDATALVMPSFVEGYGLPLVEALSVGTPVITSKFGSMAEIAAPGGAILIDPARPNSIADAIERMVQDGGFRRELSAAARRDLSSWSAYAETMWAWLAFGSEGTASDE